MLAGKVALITGGTRGLGLATALKLAGQGARCVLTYLWGTATEDEVLARFAELGAPEPILRQADVAVTADTVGLLGELRDRVPGVDIFVSNAATSGLVRDVADYTERSFMKSMRGGAWPTFDYLGAMRAAFGRYPRYVVVMSSDGPDRLTPNYDFVAASKAVQETLVRYLAYRLRGDGVRLNVLRSRGIPTAAFGQTFGGEFHGFLRSLAPEAWFTTADDVANAALALCSGMFDGMSGQVVQIDRGSAFIDGVSYVYQSRLADEAP